MPRDSGLYLFNRSEIWQAPRQQRCYISEQFDHYNTQSRGFEASRDLAIIRLTAKWIEALGLILYLDGWSLVYNSSAILRMPFVATSGRDKSSEQWSILAYTARCLYSKHPFKNYPSCIYSYLPHVQASNSGASLKKTGAIMFPTISKRLSGLLPNILWECQQSGILVPCRNRLLFTELIYYIWCLSIRQWNIAIRISDIITLSNGICSAIGRQH